METTVKHAALEEAEQVHQQIPEFSPDYLKRFYSEKYNEKKRVVLTAQTGNENSGYLIGFDRFNDGSVYCCCFGVAPPFRRKGVLKALMDYFEQWAEKEGFKKIKVKTENRFREALSYYIQNQYAVFDFSKKEKTENNEIWLEKKL